MPEVFPASSWEVPGIMDDRMLDALGAAHLASEDGRHRAGDGIAVAEGHSIGVALSDNACHAARFAVDAGSSGVVGTRPGICAAHAVGAARGRRRRPARTASVIGR